MPIYSDPFTKPQLVQKGVAAYLLGSLNMLQGSASGTVADTAIAANVGSVTVQINEGPIPRVNDWITVWGTALQTGLFNTTRALITAVNITPATNQGTISYALTGTNQGVTVDPGKFFCEPGEQPETIVSPSFSVAGCIQAPGGDSQFTVMTSVRCPTMPTALTVVLQVAINDQANEWTSLGNAAVIAASAFTTGPVAQFTLTRGSLYRFAVSGLTGTGTIVAKIFS